MKLTITVKNCPETWGDEGKVTLFWQSRVRPPEHTAGDGNRWEIEITEKDGKWSGPAIGRNSDGRRFLYFAWRNAYGRMFRRIKLYQDQVSGETVTLSGVMKDGSPACSTAIVLPE